MTIQEVCVRLVLMSNTSIKLTCIVPVTRVAPYENVLRKMLNEASLYPISILLVHDVQDNHSSSLLRGILKDFAFRNVTLLEGEFGSPGDARNFGLKFLETDWVNFSDGDDEPIFGELCNLVEISSREEVDIGIGLLEVVDVNHINRTKIHQHKKFLSLGCQLGLQPAFTRMVINRSLVSGKKFESTKMGEDQIFVLDLFQNDVRVLLSNEVVYRYLVGRSFQATESLDSIIEIEKSLYLVLNRMKKANLNNKVMGQIILIKLALTLVTRLNFSRYPLLFKVLPPLLIYMLRNPVWFLRNLFLVFKERDKLID